MYSVLCLTYFLTYPLTNYKKNGSLLINLYCIWYICMPWYVSVRVKLAIKTQQFRILHSFKCSSSNWKLICRLIYALIYIRTNEHTYVQTASWWIRMCVCVTICRTVGLQFGTGRSQSTLSGIWKRYVA